MSSTETRSPREHVERTQPETLRLRNAAPGFTVDDIGATLEWYTNVLGFVVANEWKNDDGDVFAATVRAGSVEFNFGQDDFKKGRDRAKGIGFRMYCETAQDLDALAERIKQSGVALDSEPADQPWGMRDFSLTDPDGYKLTIWRPLEGD